MWAVYTKLLFHYRASVLVYPSANVQGNSPPPHHSDCLDWFNYCKSTSNHLIKNMSLKLGYILLKNVNLRYDKKLETLLKNHKVL